MTLNDLTKIFLNGNGQAFCTTQDRLRAVVMVLRDHISSEYLSTLDPGTADARDKFNAILEVKP
jgi:hypothetical protein